MSRVFIMVLNAAVVGDTDISESPSSPLPVYPGGGPFSGRGSGIVDKGTIVVDTMRVK